jgi:RNA polymerase sigma-70 factor (ECF subfamily)
MTAATVQGAAPVEHGQDAAADCAAATPAAIAAERGYLLRMALRRLRDPMLAEDVVHDTLLAALQGAAGYGGRASLRTWLTSILQHRIADLLRRRYRAPEVSVEPAAVDGWNPDAPDEAAAVDAVDHRDPAHLLEMRQLLQALAQGLQRLSPIGAQVLWLRQLEGFSNDETAARLQLDPAQVPAILHRARSRLERLTFGPAAA